MEEIVIDKREKISAYKKVCAKLGLIMCVYYICRVLAGLVSYYLVNGVIAGQNTELGYFLNTLVSVLFCYAIPLILSALLFGSLGSYFKNSGGIRALYKKPRRLAKSLGNFAAMYGLGFTINLLTILVFYIISLVARNAGAVEIEEFFDQIAVGTPQSLVSAIVMFIVATIIAPIVEEFWVRGIIYDALKPYGCGMAIIISSVLFGLLHGSLNMLFYTTALGLALGYIRYATDSLFVVTVLHMLINGVASVMLFLMSMVDIVGDGGGVFSTLYIIYLIAMLVLIVIGFVAFIKKIPVVRKYKITNEWDEVKSGKKIALFFVSVPVIIMLVFAFDTHANHMLFEKIIELFP